MSRFLLRGNFAGCDFFLVTAAAPAAVVAPAIFPVGMPIAVFGVWLAGNMDDGDDCGMVGIELEVASSSSAFLSSLPAALDARLRPPELWGINMDV